MKTISILLITLLASLTLTAQDIAGQWNGVLNVQGTQLRLVFNVSITDNGYSSTMDSNRQKASNLSIM